MGFGIDFAPLVPLYVLWAGAAVALVVVLLLLLLRSRGALIRAAATLGAVAVGASEDVIGAVDAYAHDLGLAFQIVDDLLDVESSNEALGKTAGKDAAAGKPTYPSLFGLEESRRLAARSVERAKTVLARAELGGRLAEIADWSLARTR